MLHEAKAKYAQTEVPEFLSTHPAHEKRAQQLTELLPQVNTSITTTDLCVLVIFCHSLQKLKISSTFSSTILIHVTNPY